MKYWKEEEISPVEKMEFWKGDYITKLEQNEVFVFGANPQARHFAGAAKAALGFGAVPINVKQNKPGIARGLSPNNKTFALITKSLEAGYTEPETGITYHKEGFQSVSPEQIRANVDELYETAKKSEHLDKKFLVTYQYEAWPNGTPKKSLNGYTSQEMLEMFAKDKDIPPNIIFHETYKPHLEKLFKKENKQSNGNLVVYENDKTIDIKEENIVWTIDSDERNPQGRHGKGAAAAAVKLGGAIYGKASGMIGPQAYGIITKSLKAGFTDKNGFTYHLEGERSISPEQIKKEIDILYQNAMQPEHQNKHFIISYQYETYHNGTPKKSLNGYTSQEMLEMFVRDNIPPNIVFHESYKPHLEKILAKEKDQHSPSLINYRNYEFISVEQFIMFSKAKTFKDEELANKIINLEQTLSNNRAARDLIIGFKNSSITRDNILAENADIWETIHHTLEELGKNVANYDESVWAVRKIPVTSIANREKYSQNPHIKITNTATQENNLPIQSSIKRSL